MLKWCFFLFDEKTAQARKRKFEPVPTPKIASGARDEKEDIHVSTYASPINNNKDRPGCDIVPPLFWLQQKNIVAYITTSVAEIKKSDEFRAWNKSKFEPSTTWKNRAMVRAQAKA